MSKKHDFSYVVKSFGDDKFVILSEESEHKDVKSKLNIMDSEGYKYNVSLDQLNQAKKRQSKVGYFSRFDCSNPFTIENISTWILNNKKSFRILSLDFVSAQDLNLVFACDKCGNEWKTNWNNIKNGGDCSSDVCKHKRASLRGRKKGIKNGNTLSNHFPELLDEWDYRENIDVSPHEIAPMSDAPIWWICSSCGNKWKTRIKNRTYFDCGCPKCKSSHGENKISKFLVAHNIKFEYEFRFSDCKRERCLPFDFWLPEYNTLIEYHGSQHYRSIPLWGGIDKFKYRKQNDKIKKSYCKKNKIELIIIPYWDYDSIEKILEEKLHKP